MMYLPSLFSQYVLVWRLPADTSVGAAVLSIPVAIIAGLVPGIIAGLGLVWLFNKVNLSSNEKVLILLALAVGLVELGKMIESAALLGVMATGFILLERSETHASYLAESFGKLWYFAQILLFVLIGLSVNVEVALDAGLKGLLAIFLGLVFRSLGVLLATQFSTLNIRERVFCVIGYLPKATVQAALGGVALAAGIPEGEQILALAVLAIIFTAPMGLIGINLFGRKLLTKD